MAYNPKDTGKRVPMAKIPEVGESGKPAILMSALDLIKQQALSELEFSPGKPLKLIGEAQPLPPKQKFYIEWWKLGDPKENIQIAEINTADIKNVVKKLTAADKHSLVYLERCSDGKVVWNHR